MSTGCSQAMLPSPAPDLPDPSEDRVRVTGRCSDHDALLASAVAHGEVEGGDGQLGEVTKLVFAECDAAQVVQRRLEPLEPTASKVGTVEVAGILGSTGGCNTPCLWWSLGWLWRRG
jgi:hypothetical protein